ncbi:unnamed protein product [Brassica napus]|uniref:(rape) hypothetical protein n=1 Tax=Brassica napus TaxID=3708 RepID=A0A817AU12_BRANA|nr:unnamed protein product [Brassica napus]
MMLFVVSSTFNIQPPKFVSISITRLASATQIPSEGMHFMNPPPVMKLVEVIHLSLRKVSITVVDGIDFNLMEEEYQVKLAMAISVYDPILILIILPPHCACFLS